MVVYECAHRSDFLVWCAPFLRINLGMWYGPLEVDGGQSSCFRGAGLCIFPFDRRVVEVVVCGESGVLHVGFLHQDRVVRVSVLSQSKLEFVFAFG